MADIAIIFHWPSSEMAAFTLDELQHWHTLAVSRWNRMNSAENADE